jgi:hypothetical protein
VTKKVIIIINVFIVECPIVRFDDFGLFFLLHLHLSFSVFLAVFSDELAILAQKPLRLAARCAEYKSPCGKCAGDGNSVEKPSSSRTSAGHAD